eukprot:UN09908
MQLKSDNEQSKKSYNAETERLKKLLDEEKESAKQREVEQNKKMDDFKSDIMELLKVKRIKSHNLRIKRKRISWKIRKKRIKQNLILVSP